jgi:hypothetical protein
LRWPISSGPALVAASFTPARCQHRAAYSLLAQCGGIGGFAILARHGQLEVRLLGQDLRYLLQLSRSGGSTAALPASNCVPVHRPQHRPTDS